MRGGLRCTIPATIGGYYVEHDPSWQHRERCDDPVRVAILDACYLSGGCRAAACPDDVRVLRDAAGAGWSAIIRWGTRIDRHRIPALVAARCEAMRRDPDGRYGSMEFTLPAACESECRSHSESLSESPECSTRAPDLSAATATAIHLARELDRVRAREARRRA